MRVECYGFDMLDRRTFLTGLLASAGPLLAGGAGAENIHPVPTRDALKAMADLDPINGEKLNPDRLHGRPVIVTFWASWCPPCRWEFAQLNALAQTYRSLDLQIIGINVFEDFGGISSRVKRDRFIADTGPVFPLVAGTDQTRASFGGVTRIPTVFLFDDTGRLAWSFVHATGSKKTHVTEQEISAELMKLGYQPG